MFAVRNDTQYWRGIRVETEKIPQIAKKLQKHTFTLQKWHPDAKAVKVYFTMGAKRDIGISYWEARAVCYLQK
ncbi:MAG: hypothetical protein OIF50_02245 [Flavobacteriaceae bacterium]|nr:hypothetical protein [Flavobacteriaceae bacterium]